MSHWIAKLVVLLASITMIAIRAPYGQRSTKVRVAKIYKGKLEVMLLALAWVAFFVPLVWVVSPWLAFADYPLRALPFFVGTVCLAVGLWLFRKSHVDLGTNWSITLALRENHSLIVNGVYASARHPMYSALLLYSIGQALVLPNYLAGPSYLVAMLVLIAFRMGAEERMMRERFGHEYDEYSKRTKRLIPRIW